MTSVRVYAAMPETGSDVCLSERLALVRNPVQTLIRSALIKRAELRHVRTNLDIVECAVDFVLNFLATGIKRYFQANGANVPGKPKKRLQIIALAQEQKAVHSVIILDERVDCLARQFFTDIHPQERRMAPFAITLAIAYVNCQGNFIGYLLDDHGGHLWNIFYHIRDLSA